MAENVQTKKLYLPEEKFKHMVEKNPNLLYLREKLNTDLNNARVRCFSYSLPS